MKHNCDLMPVKNKPFCTIQTLNCRGKILDLSSPKVMGILNVTPDSFFNSGAHQNENAILEHVENMLSQGADIIDIGGASSRPGAEEVTENEELQRVIPVVKLLIKKFPEAILSVDTYRGKVALEAVQEGAAMINDISAGETDPYLFEVLPQLNVPYILMHMQGTPQMMQDNPRYENLIIELIDFFVDKLNKLKERGVKDIILDPGIGFGKTLEHNYELLKKLHNFNIFGLPVLIGLSRKSLICKLLKVNPQEALTGTTALHTIALLGGANILRVHDVAEAREVIKIIEFYKSS